MIGVEEVIGVVALLDLAKAVEDLRLEDPGDLKRALQSIKMLNARRSTSQSASLVLSSCGVILALLSWSPQIGTIRPQQK